MNQSVAIIRTLLIYTIALPLAIYLGFLLANPDNMDSVLVVGLVLGALILPMMLAWHHAWVVCLVNSAFVVPFLPGQPPLWLVLGGAGCVAAVLRRALNRGEKFLQVWPVTAPLLFLLAVVLITAKLTGGINMRIGGGSMYGGKRYMFLIGALMVFLTLISRRIPVEQARLRTALFFLSGLTAAISLLIYVVPGYMYWIFWFVPADFTGLQTMYSSTFGEDQGLVRLGGFAAAGQSLFCFILAIFGLQRLLAFKNWAWLALLLLSMVVCLYGGFRSVLMQLLGVLALVFCLERLHRTRYLPILLGVAMLTLAVLVPYANRLPLSFQRSISFLPVAVDPIAEADARGSTEWRMRMWRTVWPEVGEHLWLGKGYVIDSRDLEFALNNPTLIRDANEVAVLSGDYHSGPLSVLIPFGISGLVGLLWFFVAAIFALHRNFRYGDPRLKTINTFLLAAFIVRAVFFFLVFGSFFSDLIVFTSLVGFGITLNGGIARRPARVPTTPRPHPVIREPQPAH